jgi:plasmid stabilization system protein ParE
VTEIRWTPQAADDLQAIHDFIARDSPRYARAEIERVLAAIDQLEAFPNCGRIVPEYRQDDVRELLERPYRIVYRTRAESAIVLMIFRASRLIPTLPVG